MVIDGKLETRVGDALAELGDAAGGTILRIGHEAQGPVLATPLIAAAFAGGAVYGGGLVAAFEAGRAVRGG